MPEQNKNTKSMDHRSFRAQLVFSIGFALSRTGASSAGFFENMRLIMPGASSPSGSSRNSRGRGSSWTSRPGFYVSARPRRPIRRRIRRRPPPPAASAPPGPHELLGRDVQRRARGRGIKLALGLESAFQTSKSMAAM
jgi:hypothetical protein